MGKDHVELKEVIEGISHHLSFLKASGLWAGRKDSPKELNRQDDR